MNTKGMALLGVLISVLIISGCALSNRNSEIHITDLSQLVSNNNKAKQGDTVIYASDENGNVVRIVLENDPNKESSPEVIEPNSEENPIVQVPESEPEVETLSGECHFISDAPSTSNDKMKFFSETIDVKQYIKDHNLKPSNNVISFSLTCPMTLADALAIYNKTKTPEDVTCLQSSNIQTVQKFKVIDTNLPTCKLVNDLK